MPEPVDFEAEGLLDGLQGDARDARLALLGRLADAGVALGELRAAVADERLALVSLDRLLRGEPRLTARAVAAEAGIDLDLLTRALAAFGLAAVDPDEPRLSEVDLAAARRMRDALEAGLPGERIIDVNRVVGRAMAQVAAAMRLLVAEAFMSPGDTEDVVAARLATAARTLMPSLGPTLEHAFALHLRELLRGDAINAAVLRRGDLTADGPLSVAFADLVCTDPVALVRTLLGLVEAASLEAGAAGFPRLRAGIASGEARERIAREVPLFRARRPPPPPPQGAAAA